MRDVISEVVDENSAATSFFVNSELRKRLPSKPSISKSHLSQIRHGLLLTLKKLEARPADRNRSGVKTGLKKYAHWFLQVVNRNLRIIYIDEAGCNA